MITSEWIINNVPTLLMDFKAPHEEMLKEAMNQKHQFVPHRERHSKGWMSMCIHGYDVHMTESENYYSKKGISGEYGWTSLADQCPVTKEWLLSLGFQSFRRVRFMLLEPHGYIQPHRDIDIKQLLGWNVALNNPEGHTFIFNGEVIPWEEGQMRGFDVSNLHEVINDSDTPRIHMIIHGKVGNLFREHILRSYLTQQKL